MSFTRGLCQRQGVAAALQKLIDVHVFIHRMRIVLAGAEGDGRHAVAHQPVGVEAAVGDAQRRLPTSRSRGFLSRLNDWTLLLQAEWVIIAPRLEMNPGALPFVIDDLLPGLAERVFIGLGDRADKTGIVAARLALQMYVVG